MQAISRISILAVFFTLTLILAACASPGAADLPTVQPTESSTSPTSGENEPTPMPDTSLRQLVVDSVQVEIGEGSPLPVEVIASGTWPDLCAQVARIEQRLVGTSFEIELLANPPVEGCPPDYLGTPFRIAIPLNLAELPAGTYGVSVNGAEAGLAWDFIGSAEYTPAGIQEGAQQPLSVESVVVEVGVGSPIPVEVVASGTWPQLCAQLESVEQVIDGQRIEINLHASPSDPECPLDAVGIPFRVAVPLNMVEMPLGEYTIVVNGVETGFDWTGTPPEAEQLGITPVVAYIGLDGNLWVVGGGDSQPRPVTSDADPLDADYDPNASSVSYYFPAISSDGKYVAVRRDAGIPVESGMQYEFELRVFDSESGEVFQVATGENPPAGFDWQPGTHLLAYGKGVVQSYFTARGSVDANLATGIYAWEADSGDSRLLVEPERGYALMLPTWSPDGRFLSFDEIMYMEGRQPFAYLNLESGDYVAIDEPIGLYDWSPDSSLIAYDRLTYTATGEEKIYIRERVSGTETQVSPDFGSGYAFYPVFSPEGSQLAYFVNLSGPESVDNTLYVQELAGGEPRALGVFESAQGLEWSPDGSQLIFSAGPYEGSQVMAVNVLDGGSTVLGQGSQPSVAEP